MLRFPHDSSVARPLEAGVYFHTNLFLQGMIEDFQAAWGVALHDLGLAGRMFVDTVPRRHIYTSLMGYAGVVYRDVDEGAPLDIHALDYPFQGVVVEVIDAVVGVDRAELVHWLKTEFIPEEIRGSDAAMCLVMLHNDLPPAVAAMSTRLPPDYGELGARRVALLWLLDEDPELNWKRDFAPHADSINAAGRGIVQLAAPFIPTLPGSDAYTDKIRAKPQSSS